MTEAEKTAWLAGLLEGEGAFMIFYKVAASSGTRYPTFRVACNLCDEDTLRRVAEFAGVGCLSGPHEPQRSMHSPFWRWNVNRRADVYSLCLRILPLMGARRSGRIRELLALLTTTGRPEWRHGTRHGYEAHKCRCSACKSAHAKRFRDIRAARALRLSTGCP